MNKLELRSTEKSDSIEYWGLTWNVSVRCDHVALHWENSTAKKNLFGFGTTKLKIDSWSQGPLKIVLSVSVKVKLSR